MIEENTNTILTPNYAGFGSRLMAYILDFFILSIINGWFITPVLTNLGIIPPAEVIPHYSFQELLTMFEQNPDTHIWEVMGMSKQDLMITFASTSIVQWIYFAMMESSTKQATLGKMALRITVADEEGNRISFLKASVRYFAKYISAFLLMIGYLLALFTPKKQTLHDLIAKTFVVRKPIEVRE